MLKDPIRTLLPGETRALSLSLRQVPDHVICIFVYLFTGCVQGLGIACLVEQGDWLAQHPRIAFPLWLLVLAWPWLFLLGFVRKHVSRLAAAVSGLCALLALLATYTGWQVTPVGEFEAGYVVVIFAQSMLVAAFIALLHLQAFMWRESSAAPSTHIATGLLERVRDFFRQSLRGREHGTRESPDIFFTLCWRNFLTLGLSAALTLGFRLVLFLWESLFSAIGVDFFARLFAREWFLLPVLATTFAFGLHSFRAATSVIDSIASLLARLTWLLLPILLLANVVFLLTLPFVGLQPLWDTDHGTTILMAANLVSLLFLNTVYQTGGHLPYPVPIHRLLTIGIAMLPILSALAFYGLSLRIGQYGWTVLRCWALLITSLAACASLGYLYIIIRQRTEWLARLPEVNRCLSWVVLVVLLLSASPLLDFRAISAWSQFTPIESGEAPIDTLDVRHVHTELARPGYLRLQSLLARLDASDPESARTLRAAIAAINDKRSPVSGWSAAEQAGIGKRPANFELPEGLAVAIKRASTQPPGLLFQVDLDDDGGHEYVGLWSSQSGGAIARCWDGQETGWVSCGYGGLLEGIQEAAIERLATADFEAVLPNRPYKDLRVGDQVFEFSGAGTHEMPAPEPSTPPPEPATEVRRDIH